jgi:hypothetical protein
MTDMNRGQENNPESPIQFKGKAPPQFFKALKQLKEEKNDSDISRGKDPYADISAAAPAPEEMPTAPTPPPVQKKQYTPPKQHQTKARVTGSPQLEDLLANLIDQGVTYDEITLPSRGVFYSGNDGPANGVLHVRSMTGEEEQILSTPRYVKRGTAINMIFQRCVKENIKADTLLTVDRTYLLIWLRGISYGHEYEVEIKCPDCDKKFNHTINLSELMVNYCPADMSPPLMDVLPKCGYKFIWHLPKGMDENKVQDYRDKRLKEFGDSGTDDSLIYRMSLMLDEIEGVKDKTELMLLLKKLPIQDVSYLRSLTLDPPFGVDTKCQITCASCYHDFEVELPLEAGFFFPRHKRKKEGTSSDSGNI